MILFVCLLKEFIILSLFIFIYDSLIIFFIIMNLHKLFIVIFIIIIIFIVIFILIIIIIVIILIFIIIIFIVIFIVIIIVFSIIIILEHINYCNC
jgi:hypothetical protein